MTGNNLEQETIKVLLVDDEQELATTLCERIEMRGLDAAVAFNGQQALEALKKWVPDVMVLDLRMPGIDGMEVLERVKKQIPQIQVIILTGHGSEKDEEQARRLGAFDYFQKPVDVETLVQKIRKAYRFKADQTHI